MIPREEANSLGCSQRHAGRPRWSIVATQDGKVMDLMVRSAWWVLLDWTLVRPESRLVSLKWVRLWWMGNSTAMIDVPVLMNEVASHKVATWLYVLFLNFFSILLLQYWKEIEKKNITSNTIICNYCSASCYLEWKPGIMMLLVEPFGKIVGEIFMKMIKFCVTKLMLVKF